MKTKVLLTNKIATRNYFAKKKNVREQNCVYKLLREISEEKKL